MANLPGRFNVRITQDPRRILNKEHAEMEVRFGIKEHVGDHAYEKITLQHRTMPENGLTEIIGSVCILSLEEMENIHRHIQNLEAEIRAYKNVFHGRLGE